MTLEEVAKVLNLSVITIKNHFVRTQQTLLKKGIVLTKQGRGIDARYTLEYLYGNKK